MLLDDKITLDAETIRKLQLKSLEVYKYFKNFCEQNNLMFYFCGGCCIGTIRHEGFIPWDDDIDIFMPRKDYEIFYELWQKRESQDRYICLKADETTVTGNAFTTLVDTATTLIKCEQVNYDVPYGVSIDIFPLDACPNRRFDRMLQMFWALVYSLYISGKVPKNHGRIAKFGCSLLLQLTKSYNIRYKIAKFAEKNMAKYDLSECRDMTELCAGPGYMKNRYPKDIFASSIYKKFENMDVPLPVGYDKYLKIAFGDYMKLPPESQRVPHHDIAFLDLDNGYKKYKLLKEDKS